MTPRKKSVLILVTTLCALSVGVLAAFVVSLQSLVILNDTPRVVEVRVCDRSWTIPPKSRRLTRFTQSCDGHFDIIDKSSGNAIEAVGYLTSGSPACHTLSIGDSVTYDVSTNVFCHISKW